MTKVAIYVVNLPFFENQVFTCTSKCLKINLIYDHYKEKNGFFPPKIVAQSSGNHAQAVAFVGKKFKGTNNSINKILNTIFINLNNNY